MKYFPNNYLLATFTLGVLFSLSGCTEPKTQRDGCVSDVECKGDRICSAEGQCVPMGQTPDTDASDHPDAGNQDTDPPDDTQNPDDTNNDDDGEDPANACAITISAAGADNNTAYAEAAPSSTIQLDGRQDNSAAAEYHWRFVQFPYSDSIADLKPEIITHANGTADFKAETLGTYTVELDVTNSQGTSLCDPVTAQVLVGTDAQIYVELVWDTPGATDQLGGNGSDLDLHYKHPDGEWGEWEPPLDIFWYTPTADWGIPNDASDDPELRRIVDSGPGPEATVHPTANPLVYSVGIYTYDDYGYGPSRASVRVYLDGDLADEVADIDMPETNHFYEVLSIDAGQKTIEHLDVHHEDFYELD